MKFYVGQQISLAESMLVSDVLIRKDTTGFITGVSANSSTYWVVLKDYGGEYEIAEALLMALPSTLSGLGEAYTINIPNLKESDSFQTLFEKLADEPSGMFKITRNQETYLVAANMLSSLGGLKTNRNNWPNLKISEYFGIVPQAFFKVTGTPRFEDLITRDWYKLSIPLLTERPTYWCTGEDEQHINFDNPDNTCEECGAPLKK